MHPIALHSLIRIFFPEKCSYCASLITETLRYPLCRDCRKNIFITPHPHLFSSPTILRIWSCASHHGVIRKCILDFKYRRQKRFLALFSELIQEIGKPLLPCGNIDLIVPVPIHTTRFKQRGYNQSTLIASILSKTTSLPLRDDILIKKRATLPQTGLSRSKRIINVKSSFAVKFPGLVKNKSILVVDDILTTGATLDACAKELLRAGAGYVSGFTISRTI